MKQFGNKVLYKKLGSYLKEARKKKGFTQESVGYKLKLDSAQFISNFERGTCAPPFLMLKKLIKIYELDTEEVIDFIIIMQRKALMDNLK